LAATLFRLGEIEPARNLVAELLTLRLTFSSANDCVTTLATASAVVTRLLEFERWKDALPIQESIVHLLRHVRGHNDLDTLRETWLLGIVVLEAGEVRRARQLLQTIVAAFSCLLGRAHPETLRTFSLLAALVAGQGDYLCARAILERSRDAALTAKAGTEVLLRLSRELEALRCVSKYNSRGWSTGVPRESGNEDGRIPGEAPYAHRDVIARLRALHLNFWKQ
jgi:hypothetical protein